MRKKLPEGAKRDQIIGIKVTETTKKQLQFIANRECTPMSTTIDRILQEYIDRYFTIAKIDKTKIDEEEGE